jgi:hypothetical protein
MGVYVQNLAGIGRLGLDMGVWLQYSFYYFCQKPRKNSLIFPISTLNCGWFHETKRLICPFFAEMA